MNWRYWKLRFRCSRDQHQLTKILMYKTGPREGELLLACACGHRVEDALQDA